MTNPAADAARSAAAILAPSLPGVKVEAALARLIVSIASLAWTIYND
jgi:hypothetical protein